MGIGIWTMHFKGMLAFRLPLTVRYHWPTILVSFVIAVLASAVALYVATRKKMGPAQAWTGSLVMGGGIAALHYVDMAAMRLAAVTRFDPLLVGLSIVLAILFSRIALMFTFDYREDFRGTTLAKVISAAVMGAAISLMHYTGMAAASFMPVAVLPNLSNTVSISSLGNYGISIVTLLVLGTAISTSSVDRQTQTEVRRLNERLEQRVVERTRQLTGANEELRRLSGQLLRLQDEERRGLPGTCMIPPGKTSSHWQRCLVNSAIQFLRAIENHVGFFPSVRHWRTSAFVKSARFPMSCTRLCWMKQVWRTRFVIM